MMDSIWNADVQMPRFPQLDTDIHTDVLIIGGGLAGLLCAWNLNRAGMDCMLIEQGRIMGGVSGRTTAKLTAQHGLIYEKLLKKFGPEKARLYWQVNLDGVTELAKLAESIDCDFQIQSSYLYATDGTKKLEAELAACEQLEIPVRWESTLQLPFPVAGALRLPDQGQFHPLKLAAHLANGLPIYENTKAMAFAGNRVQTPKGTVTAQKIIVATHFPMLNKHGAYFLKLYQERSYVIALENAKQPEGMYAYLFSPQRSMMHKQLFVNGLEATSNLLLPTKPRCPHLGCALHWNRAEHSWDCSCHGSRFDKNGRLLNNPATDGIKHLRSTKKGRSL